MIVLLPISQFGVRYEVVGGRPYSRFEQLVLRAIEGGVNSLVGLEQEFQIHSRLVIEALVTLTQAGWIAVGERGFSLTEDGRRASSSDEKPETRVSEEGRGRVLMERLTGGVISGQRATFITDSDLREAGKWDSVLRIPARVHESELDAGQVQHCLARHGNEWIARIGPIRLTSKEGCWLPVNVDLGRSKASLLPSEWHARLESIILSEAERRGHLLSDEAKDARWKWPEKAGRRVQYQFEQGRSLNAWGTQWVADLNPGDFLFSVEQHRQLLRHALEEAKSQVFIVSAFMRAPVLEEVAECLRDAVRRGVYIDILWGFRGETEESGPKALEFLLKVAADRSHGTRGRIRFNREPSGSHAKALLWDSWAGVKGCIGSFNWLSARSPSIIESRKENNASVRFSHPGILSAIARTISGLWMRTRAERLGSTAARLDVIAAELDRLQSKAEADGNCPPSAKWRIGIVRDLEHEGILNALMRTPPKRFFLSSYGLSEIAKSRLAPLLALPDIQMDGLVAYSESEISSEDRTLLAKNLAARGIKLSKCLDMHAKVILGDRVSYVGSYNFLSGDPLSTASGARELGVTIFGEEPVAALTEWSNRRFIDCVEES